jgi:glycosyltransferase involved in cell wall biosynthesis
MSQLKKCMLTIGIPTYNGGDNFIELFSSINNLGLAKDDYEIVVVDNASTDGTAERMEQFRLQLPNLNYHRNLEQSD